MINGIQSAKLPQYFKERNQITTVPNVHYIIIVCEVTTIFQRTKSNHNGIDFQSLMYCVRSYHNISKNEIKSQPFSRMNWEDLRAKLPQYFKERNQITTKVTYNINPFKCEVTTIFQRTKSNHNTL